MFETEDPHHVVANPDPTFHFDADPDPTFFYDADPFLNLVPHQREANLRRVSDSQTFHGSIWRLTASFVCVCGPSMAPFLASASTKF
jgi:hypothetical protein